MQIVRQLIRASRLFALPLAVALLASMGVAWADDGPELRVSGGSEDHRTWHESPRAVAMDRHGNFVMTWSAKDAGDAPWDVYARRYNARGEALGDAFRVNQTTGSSQLYSTVAMHLDGAFVITRTSENQDGDHNGVYARRYNAAGHPQGDEFRVNTTTFQSQRHSVVAIDHEGDFVIVWSSAGQDNSGYGVYARLYNAAGVAQTGEILVPTSTRYDQLWPMVAMDHEGEFVVTWSSRDGPEGGNPDSVYGIWARRFNDRGEPHGDQFRVNQRTAEDQRYSTVAMDHDGNFVITWTSHHQHPDTSGNAVVARRYNARGEALGDEFVVNTFTADDQQFSVVAMDHDGDFVITWSSDHQDGSDWGVYAQRFAANGDRRGGEFRVNETTAGS